jgi:hypothetical protein
MPDQKKENDRFGTNVICHPLWWMRKENQGLSETNRI